MSTELLDRPDTTDQDHDDVVAHIIWASNPRAAITQAIVEGMPLQALCGKIWVPHRDPKGRPVCERCLEIKRELQGQ